MLPGYSRPLIRVADYLALVEAFDLPRRPGALAALYENGRYSRPERRHVEALGPVTTAKPMVEVLGLSLLFTHPGSRQSSGSGGGCLATTTYLLRSGPPPEDGCGDAPRASRASRGHGATAPTVESERDCDPDEEQAGKRVRNSCVVTAGCLAVEHIRDVGSPRSESANRP